MKFDVAMERDGVRIRNEHRVTLWIHEPADVLALAATLQAYGEQMQAMRLREVKR